MTMTDTDETPRVYVASLTDYNAGILHGVWIDLDDDADEDTVGEAVRAMLEASPEARRFPQGGPAEEAVIHDYEGFHGIRLGEQYPGEYVLGLAAAIREHGAAYAAYAAVADEPTVEDFQERFMGHYDSPEAYAEEFYNDMGTVNDEQLLYYAIDWSRVAHELDQEGLHFIQAGAPDYGVWVIA